MVNNQTVLEPPVEIVEVTREQAGPGAEQDANADFGADFPGLIETPLVSEDPLLEDPVTSGGDSSLNAAAPTGDESEEDSADEESTDES